MNKYIIATILLILPSTFYAASEELQELRKINMALNEIKNDIQDIKKGITGNSYVSYGEGVVQKLEKIERKIK